MDNTPALQQELLAYGAMLGPTVIYQAREKMFLTCINKTSIVGWDWE